MLTKAEVELLAAAYKAILAWGRLNKAAESEQLAVDTDPAEKSDRENRLASILPQEALSKETNQKHTEPKEPKTNQTTT